jgi:hypothetical protein
MRRLVLGAVVVLGLGLGTVAGAWPAAGSGSASISGTARAATPGQTLAGVQVDVIGIRTVNGPTGPIDGPVIVAGGTTAADGTYTISGLDPSGPDGYFVCFDMVAESDGAFDSQCWQGADNFAPFPNAFGLVQPAAGSTGVLLDAGQSVSGIDSAQRLNPAVTAITGLVSDSAGRPLRGATVDVFRSDGSAAPVFPPTVTTAADGTFALEAARSDNGYFVCVDASSVTNGASTGYVSECAPASAWAAGLPPTGQLIAAHRVAGASVQVSLVTGGAVAGTTREAVLSTGVRGVGVDVFDAANRRVGRAVTDAHGRYRINGLPAAAGDRVCFEGASGTGGVQLHGYRDQCHQNVRWSAGAPIPPSATTVAVAAGVVHSGINAALTPR